MVVLQSAWRFSGSSASWDELNDRKQYAGDCPPDYLHVGTDY